MNAYMNISVRVISAAAQAQIKALQAQIKGLQAQNAAANATAADPRGITSPRNRKSMMAWGNQIQWTGRQLQYNWTLPLLLAGGAAAKFQLDNEKAFTRVQKVYGDTDAAAAWFRKNQQAIPDGMNAVTAAADAQEKELAALQTAFEAMSSRYGVVQKDVLETAGAWAAAGASGVDLARSTELSLKAAVLGDMDLAKATEALIAIQAQYSLGTKELGLTLAELNSIENQTGISMQGLIDGFARSAGVAREAGVDVRHLGAMLAALVPATGSAANAGNSLKTIISRLMSPTGDAAKVMKEFGVNTADAAWQSSTAVERLSILAGHMDDTLVKTGKSTKQLADDGYELSDSQKQVVASVLGSRYQMNRFLVLMREMAPAQSYYESALDATADRQKVFETATRELNAVLDSNPQKLKIIWTTMQNGMATAIQPMIPYIIYLAQVVGSLVQKFNELDPSVQKFALISSVALAAVGPLVRYFGSLATLIGAMAIPFKFLGGRWAAFATTTKVVNGAVLTTRRSLMMMLATMLAMPFSFMLISLGRMTGLAKIAAVALLALPKSLGNLRTLGPKIFTLLMRSITGIIQKGGLRVFGIWGLIASGIIGLIYRFRGEIAQIWNNIVEYFSDSSNAVVSNVLSAWNALPTGVTNALVAVVKVVREAALAVYEWFSYINPFARHSPSLVENVTAGMEIVGEQFAGMRRVVGSNVRAAYSEIKAFGAATRGLMANSQQVEINQQRQNVKKQAPGALDEFNALASRLGKLRAELSPLEVAVDKQQAVVDKWSDRLELVNRQLDIQQKNLDRAQSKLNEYSSAPIKGMQSMSDAIFANEMAQKRLRLEMMKMEDAGQSFDDIKSKIDAIRGAQELLSGTRESLRSGGAGGDILKTYDDQIAALERQAGQHEQSATAIQKMADELAKLERIGERLDLENSIKFDPLLRQIEQASNLMQEMPFDRIMAGIASAAAEVKKYQPAVDTLTATRDRMQDSMDREQAKLDDLKKAYDRVADAVSAVESAMQNAAAASDALETAKKSKKNTGASEGAISPAVQNFRDAAGGNFANVGGAGIPVRTDWANQADDIAAETARIADDAAKVFGSINPFAGIKEKWNQFKGWFVSKWNEAGSVVKDIVNNIFSGVGDGNGFSDFANKFIIAWQHVKTWFNDTILTPIQLAWSYFGNTIINGARETVGGIIDFFKPIGKAIADNFSIALENIGPFFKGLGNLFKVLVVIIGPIIAVVVKLIGAIWTRGIRPLLSGLGMLIAGVVRVFGGLINFIMGFISIFSGDFKGAFKQMAKGVLQIFWGLGEAIVGVLKAFWGVAVGVVMGVVDAVIDTFLWLYDVLVGHSIIPDLVKAIVWWFKSLWKVVKWIWNNVAVPIIGLFKTLFKVVIGGLKLWWSAVTAAFGVLKAVAKWLWSNVLLPIVNVFKYLWSNWIKPSLVGWWELMKLAWAGLKTAGTWLWENVLKPIWTLVKNVWTNFIEPLFKTWWALLKIAWTGLKTAAVWLWENVLKPIWNKVKALWDNWIKPSFKAWWAGIKLVWAGLKTAGTWLWENVLKPVWNRVKDLWNKVKESLRFWWSNIKKVWADLKGIGTWFKTNVMDKVFNAVTGAWNRIKNWLEDNKSMITKPMKGIVNTIISAVNKVISGLNKVSDILPGVKWNIELIPKLEQGGQVPGRRANRGFVTSGARAIVGEGKANYPEFVIPTDPTYRSRAKGLLAMAASKIGVDTGINRRGVMGDTPQDIANVTARSRRLADTAIPQYAIGGWLGDSIKGMGKGVLDKFASIARGSVKLAMDKPLDLAERKIRGIGWNPAEAPPLWAIGKLRKWVTDTDRSANKAKEEAGGGPKVRAALAWARSQAGKPYVWGGVGPDGYDCSGFMSAIANHLSGRPLHSRLGATASFPWGGFKAGSMPKGFTIGSTPNYGGSGVGHMAGTLGGVNVESRGGQGVVIGSSARGWNDGGFSQAAFLPLKEGGIALANRGPTLAAIGDGRYDEAVVPLPRGWRNSDNLIGVDSDRSLTINVDKLVLPNIKDGNDVEDLIEALERLGD